MYQRILKNYMPIVIATVGGVSLLTTTRQCTYITYRM